MNIDELTKKEAEELFGRSVPVLANLSNFGVISSAMQRRTYQILHHDYPNLTIKMKDYKDVFGVAYALSCEQLAEYVVYDKNGKNSKIGGGDALRKWRGSTMIEIARRQGKSIGRQKRDTQLYEVRGDRLIPISKGAKAIPASAKRPEIIDEPFETKVKTEVRVPPADKPKPKVYNSKQVGKVADALASIADKHDWLPTDDMVSALTGFALVNCRLARERLFDRGYYMQEGRNGAWRVLGRPTLSKKRSASDGLYTADEVAALIQKLREKGEL